MASNKRPELQAPPEIFYNDVEARKYATSSRMIEIQSQMSFRALELLNLPEGESAYLLDIGCGSGLSGDVLEERGHVWVGIDISEAMLMVSAERGVQNGDIMLGDMGQGLPFRPGTFDGAISVSALQWLCNQDKTSHNPIRRMRHFFQQLYNVLRRGTKAVFQFYPSCPQQVSLLTEAAMRCGFSGGMVIDYPNSTKAKKCYLVLFAGTPPGGFQLPKAMGTDEPQTSVKYERIKARGRARDRRNGKNVKAAPKSREW
eukprot:CAMPEP_0174252362 /NCGR_PEP_ID=MMETSP0439-20130205/1865_1 /TAXON_ID=0 /ORGANISM="Stereomyxa ramosa, Strain Chinc5" /LENGTH=257 /DNA_ID=CAMNT_0015332885 /DNA_START=23 /DNA_END=793 /DNA_ORIENTATION=+